MIVVIVAGTDEGVTETSVALPLAESLRVTFFLGLSGEVAGVETGGGAEVR